MAACTASLVASATTSGRFSALDTVPGEAAARRATWTRLGPARRVAPLADRLPPNTYRWPWHTHGCRRVAAMGSDTIVLSQPGTRTRAVRVVVGRAAVQLAVIELVELPLDPDPAVAHVLGLQPDQFAPAHTGVAQQHGG